MGVLNDTHDGITKAETIYHATLEASTNNARLEQKFLIQEFDDDEIGILVA